MTVHHVSKFRELKVTAFPVQSATVVCLNAHGRLTPVGWVAATLHAAWLMKLAPSDSNATPCWLDSSAAELGSHDEAAQSVLILMAIHGNFHSMGSTGRSTVSDSEPLGKFVMLLC